MTEIQLKDKKFQLFLTEKDILSGIEKAVIQINQDLKDKRPVFICVLNGAYMFASELTGRFNGDCEITFVRFKSYKGTQRTDTLDEIHPLIDEIENRHIIIVEDIIDSGHTIKYLVDMIKKRNPLTIKIATLLFKPDAIQADIRPDYVAKEIPNDFIVGFGLDYDGLGRNLRNIYKIIT